jgi:hypothetical protein
LRYLKLVGYVAATLVAAAGAVNWAADPLAVFGTPRVSGLNARKPYLNHDRELARFALAHRHCKATKAAATPAGLAGIFGNSRAEIGFNPEHAAFARLNLKAFNHALGRLDAHVLIELWARERQLHSLLDLLHLLVQAANVCIGLQGSLLHLHD